MTMPRVPGRSGRHRWLPLFAVLCAAACGEEGEQSFEDGLDPDELLEPLPEPHVRSTYLDIFLDPSDRICPPTVERLDGEVERLAAALGVTVDPEERIVLHYGDWAVKERCDVEGEVGDFFMGGCAREDGSWIAAQPGVESHELVHHLRIRSGSYGPHYWEEGLATYLGTARPYGEYRVWASGDLRPSQSLYSPEIPDQAGYTESAHFIAFLDRTYGSDLLRALSMALGEGTDPAEAFEQTLGASLESVEARWKTEAAHMYELGPLCEQDVVVGAEPVTIRGEIGCEIPGVIGPGPNITVDVFRGPRYCLQTLPGTTLTVSARGSVEHGVAQVRSLDGDACPVHEPNLGTNVVPGSSRDFDPRGCTWSVTYVSSLEGDAYEIELTLR